MGLSKWDVLLHFCDQHHSILRWLNLEIALRKNVINQPNVACVSICNYHFTETLKKIQVNCLFIQLLYIALYQVKKKIHIAPVIIHPALFHLPGFDPQGERFRDAHLWFRDT